MNVSMFITLLTSFSVVTSLATQWVKKILDESCKTYSSNILVSIISCIVGIGGTAAYYIIGNIEFGASNIVCMILMGIATSMGSMVGYDKVIQTIQQLWMNK